MLCESSVPWFGRAVCCPPILLFFSISPYFRSFVRSFVPFHIPPTSPSPSSSLSSSSPSPLSSLLSIHLFRQWLVITNELGGFSFFLHPLDSTRISRRFSFYTTYTCVEICRGWYVLCLEASYPLVFSFFLSFLHHNYNCFRGIPFRYACDICMLFFLRVFTCAFRFCAFTSFDEFFSFRILLCFHIRICFGLFSGVFSFNVVRFFSIFLGVWFFYVWVFWVFFLSFFFSYISTYVLPWKYIMVFEVITFNVAFDRLCYLGAFFFCYYNNSLNTTSI